MNTAEKIFNELRIRLENGVYIPGSRFPSESMLADEFSVNKMTMNKVVSLLAERKYLIRGVRGAGTRVAEISSIARGAIAFLSPLTPYTICVLRGVYAEAVRHNFTVMVESPAIEDFSSRMEILQNQGVCGIVSATWRLPCLPEKMLIFCVDSEPYPVPADKHVHFINSDNFQGGCQMMNEIMRRGHREILIFSSERFHTAVNAPKTPRVCGFHHIMEQNGITDFEERTFYSPPASIEDAKRFLKLYLKAFPKTTMIAADSDGSAGLINSAALELGVDCPGKITLTGFGNVLNLPIANVDQNPERQGELAARYIIEYANSGKCPAPLHEKIATTLTGVEHIPIILER